MRFALCLSLLLSASVARADASLVDTAETWSEAPQRHGWFQLPDGYELTFVEDHRQGVDGFILRKDGARTRFDSRELHPERLEVTRLNAVRIGSRGGLRVELLGEEWNGTALKEEARTTVARLQARYHEARATVPELTTAIARDPLLASVRVTRARRELEAGDRAAALATVRAGIDVVLPTFYFEALLDPVVAPLLDDESVRAKLGPRDGKARLGQVAWSPRLGLAAWPMTEDSEADDLEPSWVIVQPLDGAPLLSMPIVEDRASRAAQRYLADLGFQPGRAATARCSHRFEDDGTIRHDARCWTRMLRRLGIADVEARGDRLALYLRGRLVTPDLFADGRDEEDRISTVGWLPGARALFTGGMPRGPCTAGGAPGARSWITFRRLSALPDTPATHNRSH